MTRPQLLDKIEEAQKKLNTPEEPQKEILAVGSRSCSDTIKGVKRKKIVTENHLKKIPKSPLRNVAKEKQRHDLESSSSSSPSSSGSGHTKDKELLPVELKKQNSKQSKGLNSELSKQCTKSGVSMQAKKLSFPPDLCNGRTEGYFLGGKMTLLKESSTSSALPVSQKCANSISENTSKQYSCANSAFDVLLKAMEPELNTLNQSRAPCGTQTEKQGHNKNPASLVTYTTSDSSSSSQRELTARYLHYHHGPQNALCCPSLKDSAYTKVFSASEEQCEKQPPTACPNYSSALEATKSNQVYHVAVTSSLMNPSTSTVTQVISLPVNSLSTPSNLSLNSTYNVTQVASLITGEQMCNIVLKDQKPKKQGKYICEYCNRACAKPSVLLKHIRSHTGERPYPCITCGFSFKTKSNLYKHKKSHAHAIKLGLVLRTDSGGMLLSQDSEKALFISSDAEESGESDEDYTSEERQEDQNLTSMESPEHVKITFGTDSVAQKEGRSSSNSPVAMLQDISVGDSCIEAKSTELPKVVVYPVSVSPLRADSPKVLESTSEHFVAQMPEIKTKIKASSVMRTCSLSEVEQSTHKMCELVHIENKQPTNITVHAQLQRQQATDCSQEQQSKCLLSPRSLGSTDSGYFSRSESADQAMASPSPFIKLLPTSEKELAKNVNTLAHPTVPGTIVVQPVCIEKPATDVGIMRPPLGSKTLEERISKLISDNEALVDDKQLDSVKPKRTSLSRRGSIDSPKSYIFKDSFQFDLKPIGRRTSSSSDIPKSPFTPTDKSKQVFFLSVPSQYPSIDCLPITRSNSMPTTGYSAVPPVIPPSHPLRGSQSFDDKIGTLYDDVFVSGPSTPQQTVHPRTLVRQAAIEDSSSTEHCGLGPARSVDESYPTSKSLQDVLLPRSKSFVQGSSLDKIKKNQGRGTMFECETCKNRYRKLENFENHKKFYCSELHRPKSKTVTREAEHSIATNVSQPQVLHYRVTTSTGTLEQPLLIRKRRKMKSVGDDDEPQQNECQMVPENTEPLKTMTSAKTSSTITILGAQSCTVSTLGPQIQLVARNTETNADLKILSMDKNTNRVLSEKAELKCPGSGISVIQHTNSLSRPNSFEKSESVERVSSAHYDRQKSITNSSMNTNNTVQEDHSVTTSQNSLGGPVESLKAEVHESQKSALTERTALAPQSRLVRQHNIQVPEILVTEEPDKDPEIQGNDQEPQEKFNWPQRSGSLSSLPTEKLPPKKKRIRLADLDNSSAESSFESTYSRSLSRESSLSRASSFSASFEKEENSKSESFSKVDSISKSSEFLTIPTGMNAFGVPREMRRAASEQINCTQPSMEVTDYRSKSFDCGSMSRSRSMSPTNIMTSRSFACSTNSGHIPLLERRRGPLVKQISLNISETSVSPTKPHVLQSETPQHVANQSIINSTVCSKDSSTQKLKTDVQFSAEKSQLLDISVSVNTTTTSLYKNDFPVGIQNMIMGEGKDKGVSHKKKEISFSPKYQLECKKSQETQFCSSKPVAMILPNSSIEESLSRTSWNLKADITDSTTSICTTMQKKGKLYSNLQTTSSVVVPVHNYSNSLYYGFSAITSLPEILVTQDQGSQVVCKASSVSVSDNRDPIHIPKPNEEPSRPTVSTPKNSENCLPRFLQKAPISGLVPQQETSASSKRMLSPANSLDIAMEKQQKRVKDESGAACNISGQQVHLSSMNTVEPGKPRKPMLVRQFCTTDPGESLEPDDSPRRYSPDDRSLGSQFTSFHSSTKPISDGKETVDPERNTSPETSGPSVRMSPEPSPNTQACASKSAYSQDTRSPISTKAVNIQGQIKLGAAISVVNAGDMHRLSFPSLKTSTSFTWCYLLKRKPIHLPQNDQKTSAYASWTISSNNPNPLGLPTKAAISLLNSKQKCEKYMFTSVKTSQSRHDILVYSSKWKRNSKEQSLPCKSSSNQPEGQKGAELSNDQEKERFSSRSEPRRVKIFDGGYKSNEEYVYVRGRGRGKYICEECGIRCKKPSMLKKHIRTHTDVRPYHCNYCNFSFKTKGNLTKHMKSKAHSKKCMDMGIVVGPVDDQDTDDSGERQRYSGERPGFDGEDSDGAEDEDNDNEDEDEDSQAESVLSATPSVTASPQHYPFRNSQQDTSSTDEETRVPHCFAQASSIDILPKALITRMTALTATICKPECHEGTRDDVLGQKTMPPQSEASSPKSPCRQMSVDYPDGPEENDGSVEMKKLAISQDSASGNTPSSPVDRSTQTMDSSVTDCGIHQQTPTSSTQQPSQVSAAPTHLFSHLPLHSQQPVRSPYSMIPVGGIQLVPAGLAAYSTFVPFPAGQVQLTIPAVGVIHRTASTPGDKSTDVPSTPSPIGVAEVNGVVPCIPFGQVNMPGLSTSNLQPMQPLSMETLNILGLSNPSIAPHIHPSGLTLNALGLQVLTTSPAPQSNPSPQTHIPGLQILNIALPTLIPSISPLPVDGQGVPDKSCSTTPGQSPTNLTATDAKNIKQTQSSHVSSQLQESTKTSSDGAAPERRGTACNKNTDRENQLKPNPNIGSSQNKTAKSDRFLKVQSESINKFHAGQTLPPLRHQRRTELISRQATVQYSDSSSDDDEGKLVIATT
ncbi:zinc finger protein 40 isoform X2 [Hyperolius riggenbachi]|uniref:zinc finger protein 40 isoform X2 n=1 Tax=Hyperolius riggenbachi TaxID=752182 RepID=UPI0035A3BCEF